MSVCGISLSSRICLHLSIALSVFTVCTSLGHPIGPILFKCFLPGKSVWHFSDRSYKSTSAPCWRVDARQERHLPVWCWTGRGLRMLSVESIPIWKSSSWHSIPLKRSNRTLNLQRGNKFCQLRQNQNQVARNALWTFRMASQVSDYLHVLYWKVRHVASNCRQCQLVSRRGACQCKAVKCYPSCHPSSRHHCQGSARWKL